MKKRKKKNKKKVPAKKPLLGKEFIINKEDHNYYGFKIDMVCEKFEGELTYCNTFCLKGITYPVAVFHNTKPNRKKSHKDYMLLWVENENTMVGGMDKTEMEKYREQTGIACPNCKDIIYSTYRHDFRHCTCGKCMVDGGRDYVRTNLAGKMVRIDLLTDEARERWG